MKLIYNATDKGDNPITVKFGEGDRKSVIRYTFETDNGFYQEKDFYLEDVISNALSRERSCHFSAFGSYDPDGEIVSYHWDFGDGNNATGMYADHVYSEPGEYVVTLTVTDNEGAENTIEYLLVVDKIPSPQGESYK